MVGRKAGQFGFWARKDFSPAWESEWSYYQPGAPHSVYLIARAYKNGSGTVEFIKEVGEKITAISLLSLRPKSQHFSLVLKTYCTHSFLER